MKINTEEHLERLKNVNELLAFIVKTDADRHNPFFGHKEDGSLTAGCFVTNDKQKLQYIDPYTKEVISLHPNSKELHRKCSEGGTGQEIIRQLGDFIKTGKQGHLNDYKEIWGFSFENTMKVRQMAFEIGFIKSTDYPYKRWGD